MKDQYDPDFDSPEARANFATRHIIGHRRRAQLRKKLLEEYRAAPVVQMFPGHDKHRGNPTLRLQELQHGGVSILTHEDADAAARFTKLKRRTHRCDWQPLVDGEWSQSPYHQGRHSFVYRCSPDKRYWAILSSGFPKRIVAAAESEYPVAQERILAMMLRRLREQGGDYVDMVWEHGDFEMDVFWEIYWEKK